MPSNDLLKAPCERIPRSLLRGKRAHADRVSVSLRFEDSLQLASGSFNLLVEVTGEKKKDKAAKVATARTLWVPAINNHGGFGRWAVIEVADPWDAKNTIRASLQKGTTP